MILSFFFAKKLMQAQKKGLDTADISLDLGKTYDTVKIEKDRFVFPDGMSLTVDKIKKVVKKDTSCFLIRDDDIVKIQLFSELTNKYYKLMPTKTWPTIEISGIRMHCVKDITPKEDTERKISFVTPCKGVVLDTCRGLGYTAIMASKSADHVHSFEIDENVITMQRINPWSKELFDNPKITLHTGDIFKEIRKLEDGYFDRIIHDPPRLSLATLLYSQEFYDQLSRVMKSKGILFHYTGNPGAKNRSINLKKNVMKRLKNSGFTQLGEVFNGVKGIKK